MDIPQPLSNLLSPLFQALPLASAMPDLVPVKTRSQDLTDMVARAIEDPCLAGRPELKAALWLYVDDLERSHQISQTIESPVGWLLHGIMHRREGDFWNSKYWFRKAGDKHVLTKMEPAAFVDRVERSYMNNPPDLVEMQRQEWQTLFEWCAREPT